MTDILKRKDFARWQSGEKLPDAALCKAVQEMESGLIDADLGGSLYKKRVARPGGARAAATARWYRPGSATATCSCMGSRRTTRRTSRRTKEGAAIRRQGVLGTVRGSPVESIADRRVIGGAL